MDGGLPGCIGGLKRPTSEASEEIQISPTTLQRLREITRSPVELSEKETINPSDNEEEDRSSDWETDDEIPLA